MPETLRRVLLVGGAIRSDRLREIGACAIRTSIRRVQEYLFRAAAEQPLQFIPLVPAFLSRRPRGKRHAAIDQRLRRIHDVLEITRFVKAYTVRDDAEFVVPSPASRLLGEIPHLGQGTHK